MVEFRVRKAMLGGMKSLLAALIIFLVGLAQAQTNADLKMTLISPADFQVFQRQTAAGGKVVVEGMLEGRGHRGLTKLDKLEGRVIGGTVLNYWKTLAIRKRVRRFPGQLAV